MNGVPPFTLGHRIDSVESLSETSIVVRFTSSYAGSYLHQLYIGRTLAGVTEGVYDRHIVAPFELSTYPEHLQLLAVDPSDRNTDFGADLPDRPYNRVKIFVDTTGMPADTERIEISAGTEPEGAVDTDNIVASDIYRGVGDFEYVTTPLGPGGDWNFEVAGRDGTNPDGNRGTALELTATITAHPPDVEPDGDGERFTVEAAAGVLTIAYSLPEF